MGELQYRVAEPLELAVIIPTFNERDNIRPVLENLARALSGISYEVIFVDDDSGDGTADEVRSIGRTNPRIRVLQRIQRRGLASACLEGMMATPAPYIAVMDADLQHDERILPKMFAKLKSERLDLVVATRNAAGGSKGTFAAHRVFLSDLGHRLSLWISHADISDPMSGFFVLTREYLEEVVRSASGVGFKILLDLVASAQRPVRVGEVPYTFRERIHGSSKLDIVVGIEYLQLLLDKKIGKFVPVRFLIFSAVGAIGVMLALSVLFLLVRVLHVDFVQAQIVATFVAMTGNFFLNNSMTYRDRRLKGWRIFAGLLSFYAACSVGALINVRMAEAARGTGLPWYIAGAGGLVIGAVWNYGITSFTTWRHAKMHSFQPRKSMVKSA
jgi:dolichol-phosphate mannosyltransferase